MPKLFDFVRYMAPFDLNCLGFLVPNVELPPICHSQFRPGPPSEQAQTASNFLRQVIDNSRLVNLEDLCVKPGKLAW